ncbi:uncharacterized protein LOC111390090 [Olea europaea var. sylvestris]|uniref:uncharacterized protein LOC111390090 n=1 Tax=Olea europaea var. sylvestris TaxID=158386 RepID=UPI000C1D6956|nr:uncharacterized protein LOC111390090 [Olea europaea var. sylvestris]
MEKAICQLAVVSVAHKNVMLSDLFNMLVTIVNLVGASCKHVDTFRTSYHFEILERLNIEKLFGRTDVLENISEDDISLEQKSMDVRQMDTMQDFQFVFSLYFMFEILAITDDFSQAFQKKHQDIQNAMRLLKLYKYTLQNMRDNGWFTLLSKIIEFCVDRHISMTNMDDIVVLKGRPRGLTQQVTYYHRFYVDLYCYVIDSILQELNDHLIKNDLRNKMGDELLNDNLVIYVEKDLFIKLENEAILQRYQNMRP